MYPEWIAKEPTEKQINLIKTMQELDVHCLMVKPEDKQVYTLTKT